MTKLKEEKIYKLLVKRDTLHLELEEARELNASQDIIEQLEMLYEIAELEYDRALEGGI